MSTFKMTLGFGVLPTTRSHSQKAWFLYRSHCVALGFLPNISKIKGCYYEYQF